MIQLNKSTIAIEQFPNKESKIKDFNSLITENNLIEFTYEDDADLMHLFFVKKYLDEHDATCVLWINYMPYSRMDRKIEGDLFTLKYICSFINELKFNKIYIVEPHSQVTVDLLENSIAIFPVLDWLPSLMEDLNFTENDRIIFPDKGAALRYKNSFLPNTCVFEKKRNPTSGKIENMELKEGNIPKGAKCIIIDDLCSAGGTFLWSAQILKEIGASDIFLLVSHCEPRALNGPLLESNSPIQHLYCSSSMIKTAHSKITYLPLNIESYVSFTK